MQMRSVSFLWVPASCLLILAGSWFAIMELLLRRPGFAMRAIIALLIIQYAVLCLRYDSTHAPPLRPVVSVCALITLALGAYAIFADIRASHFEGYIVLIAFALIAQSLLTLTQTFPRPLHHA
jgi:hypothetical protein